MAVSISFRTDGDGFAGAPQFEAARVLREIAETIESSGYTRGPVRDDDGNRIGHWRLNLEERQQ